MKETNQDQNKTELILKDKNLSVTALYTAHCWFFAQFPFSQYFISPQTKAVFDFTNLFLRFSKLWRKDFYDLPEGLAQRHALIDALLQKELKTRSQPIIIELACGLSQRGLYFRNQGQVYYEVDLSPVIEAKKELYLQIPSTEVPEIESHLPFLITEDLKNSQWTFLDEIKKAYPQDDYIVIAEGLLMYLSAQERIDFIQRIAQIPNTSLIFDFIPTIEQPKPGIIGRILSKIMKRFTKQSFVEDIQSRNELLAQSLSMGFSFVHCYDTQVVAQEFALPFQSARTQQTIFYFNK